MSDLAGDNSQVFNSVEDKAIFWENRSKALEAQVHAQNEQFALFQAKVTQFPTKRVRVDSLDEKDPAMKKMRMKEVNKDPFVCFPIHIADMIMSHMEGIDLYRMSSVSPIWKYAVDSDKSSPVKLWDALTLNTRRDKNEANVKLLSEVEFAHLTVDSDVLGFHCLNRFSSSIEDLCIYESESHVLDNSLSVDFSKLKVLNIIHGDDWRFLESLSNCKFPCLEKLTFIENELEPVPRRVLDENQVEKALAAMPNLTHLSVNYDKFPMVIAQKHLSKLESIKVKHFSLDILKAFTISTLQSLEVDHMYDEDLDAIIGQMVNLKSLKVNSKLHYDEQSWIIEPSTNFSITSLSIVSEVFECHINTSGILRALPSLEELYYHGAMALTTMEKLVQYNSKLRILFCGHESVSNEIKAWYDNLKIVAADDDRINTSIEFVNFY